MPIEDRQGRKLFQICSDKALNNDEVIGAIQDTTRYVSTTRGLHPEYGIIYETVIIDFCSDKRGAGYSSLPN